MHLPTLFLTTLFAFTTKASSTPACLVTALDAQPDASDFSALCGSLESLVAGNITESCDGASSISAAQSAFASSCLVSETVTISVSPLPSYSLLPPSSQEQPRQTPQQLTCGFPIAFAVTTTTTGGAAASTTATNAKTTTATTEQTSTSSTTHKTGSAAYVLLPLPPFPYPPSSRGWDKV